MTTLFQGFLFGTIFMSWVMVFSARHLMVTPAIERCEETSQCRMDLIDAFQSAEDALSVEPVINPIQP